MADKSLTLDQFRTLRKDNWWVEPLTGRRGLGRFWHLRDLGGLAKCLLLCGALSVAVLFAVHLSELRHVTLPLIGSWWNLSPAFLILWVPGGFRATCYYYRKAYYRSFFQSPPACAVRDASKSY